MKYTHDYTLVHPQKICTCQSNVSVLCWKELTKISPDIYAKFDHYILFNRNPASMV
jgi:hypothetical protein